MAQKKISELTSTASVADHNIFPLVQDGVTKHIKYSDLKAPLVEQVKANVESYVDNKIDTRTRYGVTTMTELGFENNSTVYVTTLWERLYYTFGKNGVIKFRWSGVNGAYVGTDANNKAPIYGGTLIYTCGSAPTAWADFSAIYISSHDDGIFRIQGSMDSDATKANCLVTKLADNADILSIRSNLSDVLSDVSGKLDYMYNRYPSQGKVIGKWYDGRNIWRVVYLAKDLTVTSAQVGNGSIYGFIGGLTKQRDVDLVLSAKVHRKSGAALEDMEVFLAHDDCIFTTGAVNTSVSTENVDCLIVEFVEK